MGLGQVGVWPLKNSARATDSISCGCFGGCRTSLFHVHQGGFTGLNSLSVEADKAPARVMKHQHGSQGSTIEVWTKQIFPNWQHQWPHSEPGLVKEAQGHACAGSYYLKNLCCQ